MESQKLDADRAEAIINLLRDNPGISMSLGDINYAIGVLADLLAAHLAEMIQKGILEGDTTPDGYDVYRFPATNQRGTMAPPL